MRGALGVDGDGLAFEMPEIGERAGGQPPPIGGDEVEIGPGELDTLPPAVKTTPVVLVAAPRRVGLGRAGRTTQAGRFESALCVLGVQPGVRQYEPSLAARISLRLRER
jgi:hypothetical protein